MGLLFLILALICFILAAFGVELGEVNLTNFGLAFLTVAFIVGGLPAITKIVSRKE